MKLPLLLTLTFLPCLALARSTTDTAAPVATTPASSTESKSWHKHHHHHFSPEKQLARMTTKLNLSSTQQDQIKPLLVSRDEQIKAIHENASLSKEQKRAQIKTLRETTTQQIESFLTPDQLARFQAKHQHHTPKSP